jgi:tricorn protease
MKYNACLSKSVEVGMTFMKKSFLVLLALFAFSGALCAQNLREGRLMRFPDIYKNRIVFSYAGDLWLVSSQGGVASRITTSPGLELFPKFSPDGSRIAFTGQYDGNFNVYVVPAEGGQPKQLTFNPGMLGIPERMGIENEIINWFPDGKRILFISRRDTFNSWFGRLFSVDVAGGLPAKLAIPKGGLTSFSPDGSEIAYNRIFRNFRTWKRYTGGMAQDIWIYDFKKNEIQQITHYKGTDTYPMWHGDTIYFGSDRGPEHRINLYSYSLKTKQIRQLTHFKEFDVEWPSLGPDSIVFTNGGYLYVFDLKSEKARKLTVELPGDFVQARKHWENVSKLITSFDISPEGKRAVFTARGDVYTVPAKEGSIRDITNTPGAREKYATWSPDGKWIAYMSDESGEDEVYIRQQDGLGSETRITTNGKVYRYSLQWSPDSQKLAFSDKNLRLYYVDIHSKTPVQVDQAKYGEIHDYNWSPDSQWITYSKPIVTGYSVVDLYSLADRQITPVTTGFTNSYAPVFDPDGRYLYFLSDRIFNEALGRIDAEFSNPKPTGIYAVTLRADLASPFAPQSDEAGAKETEQAGEAAAAKSASGEKTKEPKLPFRIDLQGIQDRVVGFPIPPASIGELAASKEGVYYSTLPIFGLSGPIPGEPPQIHFFTLKDRKDHVLISGAARFVLSFDGKKLLYQARGRPVPGQHGPPPSIFGIIDASPAPKMPHKIREGQLNLADMKMDVDPPAEWKQIFNEVWRQERDFFYEKSMNGVDWAAVRGKYAQLLPYVKDRYDLTDILGQMIGELSNSHTYAGGGDHPDLHPVNVGLLGADFEADTAHGLYRFKKIYQGEDWDQRLRSPLTEPGVNVKAGDYLLAVNGKPLRVPENPYQLFVNTANQNVTLTVSSQPDPSTGRNIVVKPLASEFALHELDMIRTNREKVAKATDGRVGYIYLPDMEAAGLNEFVKQFFPQIRKEGLIIDVRYNGGGFVDQIIFERLRRVLAAMESARNFKSGTVPDNVFYGYMACVTNHYAASDGDFFTYFFKKYKLGPVIGERTWGGVRGIRGGMPLIDGGYITRPEFSLYGLNSQWIIENHGVEPDITVDNRPDLVVSGHDPQLEKAIQVVISEIKAHPKTLPHRPPDLPAYPSGPGI